MYKRLLPYTLVAAITLVLGHLFQPLAHIGALAQSQKNCATFKETGKAVCGRFWQYWQGQGGLLVHGLPLSNEFVEVSELDGKPYIVQYFQRTVFELHHENDAPYDVLLSHLGALRWQEKYSGVEPGTPKPGTATPTRPRPTSSVSPPPPTPSRISTRTALPSTAQPPTAQPTEEPEPTVTKIKPKPRK